MGRKISFSPPISLSRMGRPSHQSGRWHARRFWKQEQELKGTLLWTPVAEGLERHQQLHSEGRGRVRSQERGSKTVH